MPNTSLSPVEQAELARLLKRVVEDDRGFIPDPAYEVIHKLVPWPAVEVLIYDKQGRFLLTYRDDKNFIGWHIPGGYMKPGEDFHQACTRNIQKERIAQEVINIQLIASSVWLEGEHPFGYPISLIFACQISDEIAERENLRWFSNIPNNVIVQKHPTFLRFFKDWFKRNIEKNSLKRAAATVL